MMHLLDFEVAPKQISSTTFAEGFNWSLCSYLVVHSNKEEMKHFTKDGEQVTCPDCIMRMLAGYDSSTS